MSAMHVKVALLVAMVVLASCAPRPEHQDFDYEIPYNYGYEIQDAASNNFQNKAEVKLSNGDVYGSYSVLMPDGYIYTTSYNSTNEDGYRATLVKTLAPT